MATCAIAECKNATKAKRLRGSDLIFHRFPVDPKLRRVWVTKCKRADKFNPQNATVCSDHFVLDDYQRDLKRELLRLPTLKRLNPLAVPSVFSFRVGKTSSGIMSQRKARARKRESTQIVKELLQGSLNDGLIEEHTEELCDLRPDEDKENQPVVVNDTDDHVDIENPQISPKADEILHLKSCDDCIHLKKKVLDLEGELKAALHVIQCHKNEIHRLENQLLVAKTTRYTKPKISTKFTAAQCKKLDGKRRVNWSTEDIVKALSVRSVSLKAYDTMRTAFELPLPATRTLESWSQRFSCEEGVLNEVICVIGKAISSMDLISQLAVLSFDEIALDSTAVIDPTFGNISSYSKVQVMFVRGLCSLWKQPVYYKYEQDMTEKILTDVILALERSGIKVCATVCDLGPTNLKLFRELGVTKDSVTFPNPADCTRNVYVFADTPHCLKNLRNHVLDHGAILLEEHCVDKNVLLKMISANGKELKLVKHLDESVLHLNGPQRMRVRNAVQFFSHSMASLAWKCFPDRPGIGNFFEIINNGFDVLNSRFTIDRKNKLRSGFGLFIEDQMEALETLQETVETLRFRTPKGNKRTALLPCQQGFLISVRSLMALYQDLKAQHGITYILTSRLNQDSLESLFGRIRSFGGPNSHPTAVEFRYRLKLVLLGGSTKPLKGCNVSEDFGTDYLSKNLLKINSDYEGSQEENIEEDIQNKMASIQKKGIEFTEVEGSSLLYLAGYICWKLSKKGVEGYGTRTRDCNFDSEFYEKSWLGILSKGGLYVPNDFMQNTVRQCEVLFRKYFDVFSTSKYCDKKLFHCIRRDDPLIDPDILREFIRVRLRIRVKFINKSKLVMKRSTSAKLKQFVKSKK